MITLGYFCIFLMLLVIWFWNAYQKARNYANDKLHENIRLKKTNYDLKVSRNGLEFKIKKQNEFMEDIRTNAYRTERHISTFMEKV